MFDLVRVCTVSGPSIDGSVWLTCVIRLLLLCSRPTRKFIEFVPTLNIGSVRARKWRRARSTKLLLLTVMTILVLVGVWLLRCVVSMLCVVSVLVRWSVMKVRCIGVVVTSLCVCWFV